MNVESSIRKVVTRSGSRVRGYFYSHKNPDNILRIPWESTLERDALVVWEFDPEVEWFREYQQKIWVHLAEVSFSAYPDFIISYRYGFESIVEIKPRIKLKSDGLRERLNAIRKHFAAEGLHYHVVTEEEIYQLPRFTASSELLTLRRPSVRRELLNMERIRSLLGAGSVMTFAEIAEQAGGRSVALRLLANHLCSADLKGGITDSLLIKMKPEVLS